jgi:hypothetical protein
MHWLLEHFIHRPQSALPQQSPSAHWPLHSTRPLGHVLLHGTSGAMQLEPQSRCDALHTVAHVVPVQLCPEGQQRPSEQAPPLHAAPSPMSPATTHDETPFVQAVVPILQGSLGVHVRFAVHIGVLGVETTPLSFAQPPAPQEPPIPPPVGAPGVAWLMGCAASSTEACIGSIPPPASGSAALAAPSAGELAGAREISPASPWPGRAIVPSGAVAASTASGTELSSSGVQAIHSAQAQRKTSRRTRFIHAGLGPIAAA